MQSQGLQIVCDMRTNECFFQRFVVVHSTLGGDYLAIGEADTLDPNGAACFVSRLPLVIQPQRVILINAPQSFGSPVGSAHFLGVGMAPEEGSGEKVPGFVEIVVGCDEEALDHGVAAWMWWWWWMNATLVHRLDRNGIELDEGCCEAVERGQWRSGGQGSEGGEGVATGGRGLSKGGGAFGTAARECVDEVGGWALCLFGEGGH